MAAAGTNTYTSNPNLPVLPDNGCTDDTAGNGAGGVVNTLTIPDGGTISDVNLRVEMTQTWRSDIQMALVYTPASGPVVGPVQLLNNWDGSGDNLFATLDSAAVGGLCSAAANCGTGTNCVTAPGPICQPDGTTTLSNFNGATGPGTFEMRVCDRAAADLGNLVLWELTIDGLGATADVSITKTDGVTTVSPGGTTTYTIVASNAGPDAAPGTTVTDTFPAACTTVNYTSVAAGGATGNTAAGTGNLAETLTLPSGSSVTYTAVCTISAAATGSLVNTATIAAPGGVTDPNAANNSATDTDGISQTADLSITKTDGRTTVAPGGTLTYTIVASNAGPQAATGATVADTFPAPLTCTWTCSGAGGGTCTAAGSGNINDLVNLPAGGSVTYLANCNVAAATAEGTVLNNTATITAPAGVTDPTPANNSASDAPTVVTIAAIVSVPTLTSIGMVLAAAALALLGLLGLRRRRNAV